MVDYLAEHVHGTYNIQDFQSRSLSISPNPEYSNHTSRERMPPHVPGRRPGARVHRGPWLCRFQKTDPPWGTGMVMFGNVRVRRAGGEGEGGIGLEFGRESTLELRSELGSEFLMDLGLEFILTSEVEV